MLTRVIATHLPCGLDAVVPPTLVGFALINATTFAVDLGCLSVARGVLHWPVPAAATAGYAVALGLGFALNRVLNFRSHGHVGPQLVGYTAIVVSSYLLWVLGLVTWLSSAGVDYRLARLAAAACEAAYLYCGLRWVVFRRR